MIQLRALRLPLLNRIWMMSKYGRCWLHRCTYRREKQVPTDHEFITPSEKTQCQVLLISETVHGNLPQCSHTQESRVKRHFPTEKAFSSGHQPVQGKDETFFRFSDAEEAARLVLQEQRDHLLTEAKSEILKQECSKIDTLNTSICEFQRQAHSNRLKMDNVNDGYERISRRAGQTSPRSGSTRNSTSRYSHQKCP